MGTMQECPEMFWKKNPGSSTLQKTSCAAIYLTSRKPFKKREQDMLDTAKKEKANS